MKKGSCPKCGSADVRSSLGVKGRVEPESIQIGGGFLPHGAPVDRYVCVNCGYVESYISDHEKLRMIAERWPRAGMEVH